MPIYKATWDQEEAHNCGNRAKSIVSSHLHVLWPLTSRKFALFFGSGTLHTYSWEPIWKCKMKDAMQRGIYCSNDKSVNHSIERALA